MSHRPTSDELISALHAHPDLLFTVATSLHLNAPQIGGPWSQVTDPETGHPLWVRVDTRLQPLAAVMRRDHMTPSAAITMTPQQGTCASLFGNYYRQYSRVPESRSRHFLWLVICDGNHGLRSDGAQARAAADAGLTELDWFLLEGEP